MLLQKQQFPVREFAAKGTQIESVQELRAPPGHASTLQLFPSDDTSASGLLVVGTRDLGGFDKALYCMRSMVGCRFTSLHLSISSSALVYRNGVAIDRIVGFEELGGVDDFATVRLERRLERAGKNVL